jgi:hypothetical protein
MSSNSVMQSETEPLALSAAKGKHLVYQVPLSTG